MDILATKSGVDLSREEAVAHAEALLRAYTAVFEHSDIDKGVFRQKSHSTSTCRKMNS